MDPIAATLLILNVLGVIFNVTFGTLAAAGGIDYSSEERRATMMAIHFCIAPANLAAALLMAFML